MKVYHGTNLEAGERIEREGFRDATRGYHTTGQHTGVWVSDSPRVGDFGLGYKDAWFEIEISEQVIEPFEWVEEGKTYREWLVPAHVINTHARRRMPTDELFAFERVPSHARLRDSSLR